MPRAGGGACLVADLQPGCHPAWKSLVPGTGAGTHARLHSLRLTPRRVFLRLDQRCVLFRKENQRPVCLLGSSWVLWKGEHLKERKLLALTGRSPKPPRGPASWNCFHGAMGLLSGVCRPSHNGLFIPSALGTAFAIWARPRAWAWGAGSG